MSLNERPHLLIASPRPPRHDGQGDQRRTHEIISALQDDFSVEVVSWLPDVDAPSRIRVLELLGALARSARAPLTVSYVQARAPASVRRRIRDSDAVLFVTSRAVLPRVRARFAVDFIDDLGGQAIRRGGGRLSPTALFWQWEGRRIRRFDRRVADRATRSFAVSERDAAAISARVEWVPLAVGIGDQGPRGADIAFTGNLFYGPNHEAGLWICRELAPVLPDFGVPVDRVVISGRRPQRELVQAARSSGVRLAPDLDTLATPLRQAGVALAPMALGSGVQYKVLDAVGAGRPCVLTPMANRGLGLTDGASALIRHREPVAFADAIAGLLGNPAMCDHLVAEARRVLKPYMAKEVTSVWQGLMASLAPAGQAVV